MNFLAHLLLSGTDNDQKLGNFIGDFVQNREVPGYASGVQDGIRLHRQIDTFTDNHPLVRRGMRRLYARHGKYASVLVDLYYDFLLARNWDQFSKQDFDDFIDDQYRFLQGRMEDMPAELRARLPGMIGEDWLRRYATTEGLEVTLSYLSRRVSRPELLEGATASLIAQLALFEEEFLQFFPELQDFVLRQAPS